MKSRASKMLVLTAAIVVAFVVPTWAADSSRGQDIDRIQRSTEVFQSLAQTPDKGIPDRILKGAQCVAIIPSQVKVAFLVGGTHGKGVVTCRDQSGWSAPLFISVGGGSFGFQWGVTSTDFVMIFRNKTGLLKLMSDKFQIGADAEGAAGPIGREVGADTDVEMHAEVLTYSRARGAFAGIDLKGAVVQPDDSGNAAFYGNASHLSILNGKVPVPADAKSLVRAVAVRTGTATAHHERAAR